MNQRGLAPIYLVVIMVGLIAGCAKDKMNSQEYAVLDRVYVRPSGPPAPGQYLDQCPEKPVGTLCWSGPPDDKETPGSLMIGVKPLVPATEPNGCSMVYPSRSVPSDRCN